MMMILIYGCNGVIMTNVVCHLHFDQSCDSPGTKVKKKGLYHFIFLLSNNEKSNYTITCVCIYIYIYIYMHVYVPV